MKWLEVTLFSSPMGREIIVGALDALGVDQFEFLDGAEEIGRFLEGSAEFWDYVAPETLTKNGGKTGLKLLLHDTPAGREQFEEIKRMMGRLKEDSFGVDMGETGISFRTVDDEDWANEWKKYYKPFAIGKKLVIRPEWEPIGDANGRIVLSLNPGMVFGTGQHESTALCLEVLEEMVKPGDRMLDAGCGSGILSIAALLLGAKEAVGVDIDEKAPHIAYENAALNGIDRSRYTVLNGNILSDPEIQKLIGGGYDVVAANIVADVIIALSPMLPALLRIGGKFVASGIIDDRADEVAAAIAAQGLMLLSRRMKNGWVALTAELK